MEYEPTRTHQLSILDPDKKFFVAKFKARLLILSNNLISCRIIHQLLLDSAISLSQFTMYQRASNEEAKTSVSNSNHTWVIENENGQNRYIGRGDSPPTEYGLSYY